MQAARRLRIKPFQRTFFRSFPSLQHLLWKQVINIFNPSWGEKQINWKSYFFAKSERDNISIANFFSYRTELSKSWASKK